MDILTKINSAKQKYESLNFKRPNKHAQLSLYDRFFSKISITSKNCWEWMGAKDTKNYGIIGFEKKLYRAHRISIFIHTGIMPVQCVLHKCDNPSCVNPDHLFLGTLKDNSQDMIKKGRNNPVHLRGEKNPFSILTNLQVLEIKNKLSLGIKGVELARLYKVSTQTISAIKCKRAWAYRTMEDAQKRYGVI